VVFVLVVFAIGISQFIFFFVSGFQFFECVSHLAESILYLNGSQLDIAEQITFAVGTGCLRQLFFQFELYRTSGLCIDGQVFYRQSGRNDSKHFVSIGRYAGYHLVQLVVDSVSYDLVFTHQQLQLVAAQSVFRIFIVVGIQYQSLCNAGTVVQHFHLNFLCFAQIVDRSTCCGTLSGSFCSVVVRCLLVELELNVAVLALAHFFIVRASAHSHAREHGYE